MKIVVLNGGLSEGSATAMLSSLLAKTVADQSASQIETLSLRELAKDVTTMHLSGVASASVEAALNAFAGADGIIVVASVYAGSYSGLLKALLDLVGAERIAGTPVLLAASGGSDRHSLVIDQELRPLFASLGALSIPVGIYASGPDFGQGQTSLNLRAQRAVKQFLAIAEAGPFPAPKPVIEQAPVRQYQGGEQPGGATIPALRSDGKAGTLKPDFADFTPMGELLANSP